MKKKKLTVWYTDGQESSSVLTSANTTEEDIAKWIEEDKVIILESNSDDSDVIINFALVCEAHLDKAEEYEEDEGDDDE